MSGLRRFLSIPLAALVLLVVPSMAAAQRGSQKPERPLDAVERKIERGLRDRAARPGWSRVIVTLQSNGDTSAEVRRLGGRLGRRLALINANVYELPNHVIRRLAEHPAVARIDEDRPTVSTMSRVAATVGARELQTRFGFDGAGVGVAIIDSGITGWHDDLTYAGTRPGVRSRSNQRVAAFVDFVNGETLPYDDNGHGTHVAGIIAGNGYDSRGQHAGIAPAAHVVSLKVLDGEGRGMISDVIAALEYAVANRTRHNIRVVNLSVGAAVTSSYHTDPLTLAAKRAVDAGIVVVSAAGNLGRTPDGKPLWGGILAPGNAPWVLTVGASNHQGTPDRGDDTIADYSSAGPTAIDFVAKPDIVAPGTGTVSLVDASSRFYRTKPQFLVDGAFATAHKPYLSLTGTSMAAPVVSGTVALMFQANPSLTPNLVKAILQYTAEQKTGVHALRQGGGFLNTRGAVELASYFQNAQAGDRYPYDPAWSRAIVWGNRRLSGGAISPSGNAWGQNIVWGTARDGFGRNIVWGTECEDDTCFNIVWGTGQDDDAYNIVWGTVDDAGRNIVWGTSCEAGGGEAPPEGEGDGDDCFNIVWGTGADDDAYNIVWGTECDGDDCFNIVWGTSCDGNEGGDGEAPPDGEGDGDTCFNIVWGTADEGDNIVWGTTCEDGECFNIVWGTTCDENGCFNIVWGTSVCGPDEDDCFNIVWGTSIDDSDNIVWGTSTRTTPAPAPVPDAIQEVVTRLLALLQQLAGGR